MADKITEAQLFINGEFTDAVSGETFSSTDPATGQDVAGAIFMEARSMGGKCLVERFDRG